MCYPPHCPYQPAGNSANPVLTVLLGATLAEAGSGKGKKQVAFPKAAILGTCIGRLVVVPVLWTCLVQAGIYGGLLPADDRPLVLVLVLQGAMPTAMAMSVLCTSWGIPSEQMIQCMCVMYLLSLFTLPVFVTVAVYVSSAL